MSGFLFGGSVALNDNGDKVVVSIPESDANGANSGQVRVFSVGGIQYTSPPYSGCTDLLYNRAISTCGYYWIFKTCEF